MIRKEELSQNKSNNNNEEPLDTFISYRRCNGSTLASLLYFNLKLKNFKVFMDVETLEAGKFDNNLLRSIQKALTFVLILTEKALERCIGDEECNDWLHKEIVAALQCGRQIIPIMDEHFEWPNQEDLPKDMRAICRFNGIRWSHEFQNSAITKLEKFIRSEKSKNGRFVEQNNLQSIPLQPSQKTPKNTVHEKKKSERTAAEVVPFVIAAGAIFMHFVRSIN